MDKYGIETRPDRRRRRRPPQALKEHPDRFIAPGSVDPNKGMEGIRQMVREYEEYGVRAFGAFPAGCHPQVAIDDAKFYPIYAKCVELGVPIFVVRRRAGAAGSDGRQHVERIDHVMYDFPELVFVTRHGCEPWEQLAMKLMLKWPNLYYSTSAFAPRHYPKAIVDYANTRGADKIIYAGYFPMGLSLERIMGDMPRVPFRDNVWPKFLRENALKVLKLDAHPMIDPRLPLAELHLHMYGTIRAEDYLERLGRAARSTGASTRRCSSARTASGRRCATSSSGTAPAIRTRRTRSVGCSCSATRTPATSQRFQAKFNLLINGSELMNAATGEARRSGAAARRRDRLLRDSHARRPAPPGHRVRGAAA